MLTSGSTRTGKSYRFSHPVSRCVMSKHKRNILAVVTTLTVLSVVYGTFRYKRKRTLPLRVNKAITRIEYVLSGDPNYFVSESPVINMDRPDRSDMSSLGNSLNQGLPIRIRKGSRADPSSWGIMLHKITKKLPLFLRPDPKWYLYNIKRDSIAIIILEPTEDELRILKKDISSLGISRDIDISFFPHYPDR